jgi:hypothetical protein
VRTSGYPSRYVLKVLEKTCMFRILFYANTNFSVHIYMYSRTSLSHTTMISPSTFTSTTSLPAITQCNPDHPCWTPHFYKINPLKLRTSFPYLTPDLSSPQLSCLLSLRLHSVHSTITPTDLPFQSLWPT